MMVNGVTTYEINCRACGQRYEQDSKLPPRQCGACGEREDFDVAPGPMEPYVPDEQDMEGL